LLKLEVGSWKGEGRREKGEGRREKGEGRREKSGFRSSVLDDGGEDGDQFVAFLSDFGES